MSIAEKAVEFKQIESEIFGIVCKIGCEMLKNVLEQYDASLCENRDKSLYRHKGTRKKTIKTIMGEVEFKRSVYETYSEENGKSFVYLLDREMKLQGSGFFSGLLSEFVVKSCCESSFRNAAGNISELTGQTISHTAAWQVVQNMGEQIEKKEKDLSQKARQHKSAGTLESKVLFEEQDGIWLKLQGKSRKEYGISREMKLAIAYDGSQKIGKNRYRLTNKVACAGFESVNEFVKRKEGVISEVYNTDEIELRFLNGDGAEWIKRSITDETVHFQLDPFHRNKAILNYVKDIKKRKVLMSLLYKKRTDDLLSCIEAYIDCSEDSEEIEQFSTLLKYFTSNKEGLIPIHRRGINIPEDKEYRRMGCMESNIFSIIGNRMKGRRACWSIKGANHLAKLLALKSTGRLEESISALTTLVLPEKYTEEISKEFSCSDIPKSIGKGYNGFKNISVFPATAEYKWLRKLSCIGI